MPDQPITRDDFKYFKQIPTRWIDNDTYGHVNNVVYYSFFDTVVNTHLIEKAGLEPMRSQEIGLVVETTCKFMAEITYPQCVHAGIAVEKIGNSSVIYKIGLFVEGANTPAALGKFVHVYVDRDSHKTVLLPDRVRLALGPLLIS